MTAEIQSSANAKIKTVNVDQLIAYDGKPPKKGTLQYLAEHSADESADDQVGLSLIHI